MAWLELNNILLVSGSLVVSIGLMTWSVYFFYHVAMLVTYLRLKDCEPDKEDGFLKRKAKDLDWWEIVKYLFSDMCQMSSTYGAVSAIADRDPYQCVIFIKIECVLTMVFLVLLAWETLQEQAAKRDYVLVVYSLLCLNTMYTLIDIIDDD